MRAAVGVGQRVGGIVGQPPSGTTGKDTGRIRARARFRSRGGGGSEGSIRVIGIIICGCGCVVVIVVIVVVVAGHDEGKLVSPTTPVFDAEI